MCQTGGTDSENKPFNGPILEQSPHVAFSIARFLVEGIFMCTFKVRSYFDGMETFSKS